VKLWSYADLIGLLAIYWLRRQRQTTDLGVDILAASKAAVRRALEELCKLGTRTWQPGNRHAIFVDSAGQISLEQPEGAQDLHGQRGGLLDLLAPFENREGNRGPDLVRPRPGLRILPGKLGGSPHVVGTRNETRAIAALARDGFTTDGILAVYPHLTRDQIEQAIDLERQLDENLLHEAAA
jgi:uncharacterized protein (DUF433 family)